MKPNVLLIVMDSVRATNTSLHGHHRRTTPTLEKLAEDSFVHYTQARTPGIYSITSLTSMFTGLEVDQHNIYDEFSYRISAGETVWEKLQGKHAYSTGVFSYNGNYADNAPLSNAFQYKFLGAAGLNHDAEDPKEFLKGYNSADGVRKYIKFIKWCWENEYKLGSFLNGASTKISDIAHSPYLIQKITPSADDYTNRFLRWQEEQSGPWAACVNFYDTHHEYYPKSNYDFWGGKEIQKKQLAKSPHPWEVHGNEMDLDLWESFEDLYDGGIRQIDESIKAIVTELKRSGEFEDTLIIITSNHGEGFGERSRIRPRLRTVGHVAGIHECLTHVPLLVSYPWDHKSETIDKISTLRRFSDVVLKVANGTMIDNSSFVPNDLPVMTSASNLKYNPRQAARALMSGCEISLFSGTARAVYKECSCGSVHKYITWGDDSKSINLGGDSSCSKSNDPRQVIKTSFEKLTPRKIWTHPVESVDELHPYPVKPEELNILKTHMSSLEYPFCFDPDQRNDQ